MLFSTKRMSTPHHLPEKNLKATLANKTLERVSETKLLGIHFDEHLTWNKHIKTVISSCHYSTLRKLKNFTTFNLRKQLAKWLVLSKINFNDLKKLKSLKINFNDFQSPPKSKQKSCKEFN